MLALVGARHIVHVSRIRVNVAHISYVKPNSQENVAIHLTRFERRISGYDVNNVLQAVRQSIEWAITLSKKNLREGNTWKN